MDGETSIEVFYRAVMWALDEHSRNGGTAIGFGTVLKRVGREHGVRAAERIPLPRWSRSQLEQQGRGRARWSTAPVNGAGHGD